MSKKGNIIVVSEKKVVKKPSKMKVVVEHERKMPMGDRIVHASVASTKVMHTRGAKISRLSENSIRVKHREYLQDVSSTSFAWSSRYLIINPGSASCFPWLSGIAWQYEMYELKDCRFYYEPVAPTVTAGSVMLAIDYDVADANITNKLTLMSLQNATRCAPWARCELKHDRTRLKDGPLFVRGAASPYTVDTRLYDYGQLYVADSECMGNTAGSPAAPLALGELYVEYDVILSIPQRGGTLADNMLESVTNRIIQGGSGFTPGTPFGNAPVNSPLPDGANSEVRPRMIYDTPTGDNHIIFPQVGEFLIYLATTGTTLLNWAQDIIAGSNIVVTVFDSLQNATLGTSIRLLAVSVGAVTTGYSILRPWLGGASISASVARIAACSASYFTLQLYENIKLGKHTAYHTSEGYVVDGMLMRPQISRILRGCVKESLRTLSHQPTGRSSEHKDHTSDTDSQTSSGAAPSLASSSSLSSDATFVSGKSDVVDLLTTRSHPQGQERRSFFGSLGF